ncbi:hypothetical protein [Marinicrinis sediminis]|uniref:DUF2564 family protein n=1 Tax=Marinicrinis sediminis TaxID=1652465 RepID=A0ABW5RET8_9BACL
MNIKDSSLQSQNPLSQAQRSMERVHHAVCQAQSHPNEQTIAQAYQSMEHAEQACNQAAHYSNNTIAVSEVQNQLSEEKQKLAQCQQQFDDHHHG